MSLNKKNNNGITLIALTVTIIILIILAGVSINLMLTNNGIVKNSKQGSTEYNKQEAIEKMNLKITNIQISNYIEKGELPNLQELANKLCEDEEMEYVALETRKAASMEPIIIGNATSIYTKIEKYPYEFEINSSLQLASIDGIKVAVSETENNWSGKNTWEKLFDIGFTLDEIVNNAVVFNKTLSKQEDISYMLNNTSDIMPAVVNSKVAMKQIGSNKEIYKYIFGDTQENIEVNSTWISAILNNANAINALDSTNPTTIPNMTNYTTPSGEVSASTYDSSYAMYPWKAFNSALSDYRDCWHTYGRLPAWLCYKFDEPVLIYQFYLQNRSSIGSAYVNAPYNFSIQASNDGTNWDTLGTYNNTNNEGTYSKKYVIQNINKRYYYYRIYIESAMCNTTTVQKEYTAIGRLQFYGK